MFKKRVDSDRGPELANLLAADRTDIAATLFVAAFGPIVDDPYPSRTGARLSEALAEVGGIEVGAWAWSSNRQPFASMARLVLELVLRWEQSGLACRGLLQEVNEVVLLERGADLIRSGGTAGVRDALTAIETAD
nr:hypothetical protein [Rhodococcus sp. (in: high G+C Gram-positive bacteria)]